MGAQPLLEMRGVTRTFGVRGGWLGRGRVLHAVSDVSLRVDAGDVLALVGESGSGKSTLAKILLGLLAPTSGEVRLGGVPLDRLDAARIARRVQPVFQDPYSSLNPRKTLEAIVSLPLRVHRIGTHDERRRIVREMMERVGLSERLLGAHPAELSGGQRQRVAIARALVMRPEVVVCDEPTSALDVSVQAQILNLLQDLRRDFGLTYVLITHNLAVVEHLATRVAVMYLGRIVEEAGTAALFGAPRHPYTKALLASVLTPQPGRPLPAEALGANPPNPVEQPPGCPFHPRCSARLPVCSERVPASVEDASGRVACHLVSRAAVPVSRAAAGPGPSSHPVPAVEN